MEPNPAKPRDCYRILDLVVDTGSRRVSRDGTELKLGGLTFDFLVALAEKAPDFASYDYLAQNIWNGRTVTPETISQRARMLREALSDDARSPRYFDLVRGQGYRLCAEAELVQPLSPAGRRRRIAVAIGSAVVVAAAIAFGWMRFAAIAAPPSVAVLPFADLSRDGDQLYLADGLAEELINMLTGLAGLEVASRTSSFSFREPNLDARAIGQALGVTAILEGSVRKFDDAIRITVQLIDVDTGFHLWSQTFDREFEDIFDIQEQIATAVVGALGIKLGVGGVNEFVGAGTENYEAYEAYLRGEYEKAIQLDPDYAAAWARRGVDIASTMWRNKPDDAAAIIANAYEHVTRALELDPNSSHAYGEFATLIYATMDWATAQQAFENALLRRRDDRNLRNYSNMLMRAGRTQAARVIRLEIDSPEQPGTNGPSSVNLAISLGEFNAARQFNLQTVDSYRRYQNELVVALNERSAASVRAAIEAIVAISATYADIFQPLLEDLDSPDASLAYLRALLADTERFWPDKHHDIALLAAYFGDPSLAFDAFSPEIFKTTIRFFALWYPVMADVRRLPEFRQFIAEVGLDGYWREFGWADHCRPAGSIEFVCE